MGLWQWREWREGVGLLGVRVVGVCCKVLAGWVGRWGGRVVGGQVDGRTAGRWVGQCVLLGGQLPALHSARCIGIVLVL